MVITINEKPYEEVLTLDGTDKFIRGNHFDWEYMVNRFDEPSLKFEVIDEMKQQSKHYCFHFFPRLQVLHINGIKFNVHDLEICEMLVLSFLKANDLEVPSKYQF